MKASAYHRQMLVKCERKCDMFAAMDDVCETLFEPVRIGAVSTEGQDILFLNARGSANLNTHYTLQQGFKPYADELGMASRPDIPQDGAFDFVLHMFPKNITEGLYQIARGLTLLKEGGVYLCAAHNKEGGARLVKIMTAFGFDHVQSISKNKARVVWAEKPKNITKDIIAKALEEGAEHRVAGGSFISQPGIFGWDKVDRGSALLAEHLPDSLKGQGADFGCGYGFLARHILSRSRDVTKLFCADADYRAVSVCRKNMAAYEEKTEFLWCDLTKPQALKNLDFIVMNPPFHEGKKTDVGVGADFIRNAALSLKTGGVLWMVANVHLPYEPILKQAFHSAEAIKQEKGFKVFRAVKA